MICAPLQKLHAEVVEMKDAIWQAFRETGDPLCYLLYRALAPSCGQAPRENGSETA